MGIEVDLPKAIGCHNLIQMMVGAKLHIVGENVLNADNLELKLNGQ